MIADVPGLIEGAHECHGLGHQFLRHVERTAVLIHVVDLSGATGRDPATDLDVVRRELALFDPAMLDKPQLVAANKIDALDEPERLAALQRRSAELGLPCLAISAAAGTGVQALLEAAWPFVAEAKAAYTRQLELDAEESAPAPGHDR